MIGYFSTIDVGVALTLSTEKLGGSGVSNGLLELMGSGRLIVCWDKPVLLKFLIGKAPTLLQKEV